MTHSKRPNPKEQDVKLTVDAARINNIIDTLERLRDLPEGTEICKLGEHGIKNSLDRVEGYSQDLDLFMNEYLEETK